MKLENINLGRTVVKVLRKEINDQTGAESVKEIKVGAVVQDLNAFVRVFDFRHPDDGGDIDTGQITRCVAQHYR